MTNIIFRFFSCRAFSRLSHEGFPGTPQRPLNANDCGKKNVHRPGFDLLNGARMQADHFRKAFLRKPLPHSLSAKVLTKGL
jgi:hypothetical protein